MINGPRNGIVCNDNHQLRRGISQLKLQEGEGVQIVRHESENDRRLRETFVLPVFFRVASAGMASVIAALGRTASVSDVLELLASDWRARKVGAWMALVRDEEVVRHAVLESLETSQGLLTAPDLAAAAVSLSGSDARRSLDRYLSAHVANKWGRPEVIHQAVAWLDSAGGRSHGGSQQPSQFRDLMDFARLVREANTSIQGRLSARLSFHGLSSERALVRLPARTRSLTLQPADGRPVIGCVTTRLDGAEINVSDSDIAVSCDFWDAEAVARLQQANSFVVEYGSEVGRGVVTGR